MTMPPKLTKILATIAVVLAGALHEPLLAAVWGVHPRAFAAISSLLVLFAALGISGPALAPKIAAALGNPGAVPVASTPGKPPGALLLAVLVGVATLTGCHRLPPPTTSTGFLNCTVGALHDSAMNLLDDVASALATGDWRDGLAALVGRFGRDEVACAVQAVSGRADHNAQATLDPLEGLKADRGRTWLTEQGVRFAP
jgi:hypothetical protein